MEAGAVMCRVCEHTLPTALLLAHTEQCVYVQEAATQVQWAHDNIAAAGTEIDHLCVRRTPSPEPSSALLQDQRLSARATSSPSILAGGAAMSGSLPSSAASSVAVSAATSVVSVAAVAPGAAAGSDTSSSRTSTSSGTSSSSGGLGDTRLTASTGSQLLTVPTSPPSSPARHLAALRVLVSEAMTLREADDPASGVAELTDRLADVETALLATLDPGERERVCVKMETIREALRVLVTGVTDIRARLRQHPALLLTAEMAPVPRPDDFEILRQLKKGTYCEVVLARKRSTQDLYAMKITDKNELSRGGMLQYVLREQRLMVQLSSPFVIRLFFSFQTIDRMYLVMEYANGGDVKQLIDEHGGLSEAWAKFYAAELVQALDYIQSCHIVHRDLKPENILIAASGHIKLADFGLSHDGTDGTASNPTRSAPASATAQVAHEPPSLDAELAPVTRRTLPGRRSNRYSYVGTEDYMAPEIISNVGYSFPVDWWSLGVCIYQFMAAIPPFMDMAGRTEVVFHNILTGSFPGWPPQMSSLGQDLVRRLLDPNPSSRLGARGAEEVRQHAFFADIDWANLHLLPSRWHQPLLYRDGGSSSDSLSTMTSMSFSLTDAAGGIIMPPQAHLLDDPDRFRDFNLRNVRMLAQLNRALAGMATHVAPLPASLLLANEILPMPGQTAEERSLDERPVQCLVAEDNPVIHRLISTLLQQFGAQITPAYTGTETVARAMEKEFNLIFMDIMMPEMDGSAATYEIRTRANSPNQHTPIIAFTALGDWNNDHDNYVREGMNDVLAKPFTRGEALQVFRRWVNRRV